MYETLAEVIMEAAASDSTDYHAFMKVWRVAKQHPQLVVGWFSSDDEEREDSETLDEYIESVYFERDVLREIERHREWLEGLE